MIKTFDIHTPQINLEELILLVRKGAEVMLTDDGAPLARMIPMNQTARTRIPELHAGAIRTNDDFDEPLPEEFWMGEA